MCLKINVFYKFHNHNSSLIYLFLLHKSAIINSGWILYIAHTTSKLFIFFTLLISILE